MPNADNMHKVVVENDLEKMQQAVGRDPQVVDQPNEAGLPPLYTAALYRNQRAVDFLLQHGANVDIFACAYLGKAADAKALLKGNPELARVRTPDGMTALHYAARAGHADVAQVLLECQADANARDDEGTTPFLEACHGGPWKSEPAEDVIQLLLSRGARIDLFNAAASGRTELLRSLLEESAEAINEVNANGESALFLAAHNNRFDSVRLLVEHGADVNQCDAVGTAALHRTSQQCSDELIQYLIDSGADAHLCCYVACGDEAGTQAALVGNPEAAEEKLYEFNAVGYAIHSWQLETLRILLQNGSKLSDEDAQHILRISDNDQDLLRELLAIGTDGRM